jgi:hypothetical protein
MVVLVAATVVAAASMRLFHQRDVVSIVFGRRFLLLSSCVVDRKRGDLELE